MSKINEIYESWDSLMEQRKEINSQIREIIKAGSLVTEKKTVIVRKTFALVKKLKDSGIDEFSDINSLLEEFSS